MAKKYPEYISKLKIGGFRTLKKSSLELKEGLNIVIGKNGVGKTNFVKAFYDFSRGSTVEYTNGVEYEIEKHFTNGNIGVLSQKIVEEKNDLFQKAHFPKEDTKSIKLANVKLYDKDYNLIEEGSEGGDEDLDKYYDIVDEYELEFLYNFIIDHSSHSRNIPFLSVPAEINFSLGNSPNPFTNITSPPTFLFNTYWGVRREINTLLRNLRNSKNIDSENINNKIIKIVETRFSQLTGVDPYIESLFDKGNVRFNPNINAFYDSTNNSVKVTNLYYEFNFNNEWLLYSQLSDGTKRVLLIIFELMFNEIFNNGELKPFAIIEEPELGIHPHLLHRLMLFIKEQSDSNQILLTTHSPIVLDILSEDELDRINIADYDSKKGTYFKRLSNTQKKKAIEYMNEIGMLSDYWRYSDLNI